MGPDIVPVTMHYSNKKPSYFFSTIFTGWVPTLLRAGRGMTLWKKAGLVPAEKLELFSYENNSVRISPLLAILFLGVGSISSLMWVTFTFLQYDSVLKDCS